MGDFRDKGKYLALPFRTMNIAAMEGLELAAREIIRFSHGATSSNNRNTRAASFPGCTMFAWYFDTKKVEKNENAEIFLDCPRATLVFYQ